MQSSQHDDIKSGPNKTRRDRNPTQCFDKRRDGRHCGICGSPNLIEQGVIYCNICGIEQAFFEAVMPWWKSCRLYDLPCTCVRKISYKKGSHTKYHKIREIRRHTVYKCIDCGAVRSSFCPNGKEHKCWKKADKYFCLDCSYRRS